MGKARYLGPKHKCCFCGTPFKKGKLITVDGTSDFVFCYSVQDGDCLQQYLLFNPKNRFFNVTMVYRGGFGEADPPIEIAPSRRVRGMETLSEFLNGQIAR